MHPASDVTPYRALSRAAVVLKGASAEDIFESFTALADITELTVGLGSPLWVALNEKCNERPLHELPRVRSPVYTESDPDFIAFCKLGALYKLFDRDGFNPFQGGARIMRHYVGPFYRRGFSIVEVAREFKSGSGASARLVSQAGKHGGGKSLNIAGR